MILQHAQASRSVLWSEKEEEVMWVCAGYWYFILQTLLGSRFEVPALCRVPMIPMAGSLCWSISGKRGHRTEWLGGVLIVFMVHAFL